MATQTPNPQSVLLLTLGLGFLLALGGGLLLTLCRGGHTAQIGIVEAILGQSWLPKCDFRNWIPRDSFFIFRFDRSFQAFRELQNRHSIDCVVGKMQEYGTHVIAENIGSRYPFTRALQPFWDTKSL